MTERLAACLSGGVRSDKVMRIKHSSGRESTVSTFLLECYVKVGG